MTREEQIAAIRARHARATAPHTMTQAEFVAQAADAMGKACVIELTDEAGKVRGSVSRQCTPLYDEEWLEDIGALLGEIDELRAINPIIHNDIEIRRFRVAGLPVVYGSDAVYANVDPDGRWCVGFLTGPHRCEFKSVDTFEEAVSLARKKAKESIE